MRFSFNKGALPTILFFLINVCFMIDVMFAIQVKPIFVYT